MSEFERIVKVSPAYDKRSDDPKKNYGVGACRIWFILKGPRGAVQFLIGTNWYPPHVQREQRETSYDFDRRFDRIHPDGWDVGYHSASPIYSEQPERECDLLDGGKCYYDGSSLMADEWVHEFIEGGTDWLWPRLEQQYREMFGA